MTKNISIEHSLEMAIRRPSQSSRLLAVTLAKVINNEKWINRSMKKKFCFFFVSNLVDQNIEKQIDKKLLQKIKKRPLTSGIRLLKRNQEEGLKVLVVLVTEELKNQQKLTHSEQYEFYDEILNHFFPDVRFATILKDSLA